MTIRELTATIRKAASRNDMPVDEEVYAKAGRDPFEPILYAGSLDSSVAFFGRDLGRHEVMLGQPLIGGAGRRIRCALYRRLLGCDPSSGDAFMAQAVNRVLLTNTVPYKPNQNKAYPQSVKERFRPFIAELLCSHWKGTRIITLGREAFFWFEPYTGRDGIESFWSREDRFESELPCVLSVNCSDEGVRREVILAPLPHPSPQNATYWNRFPDLLERRLDAAF